MRLILKDQVLRLREIGKMLHSIQMDYDGSLKLPFGEGLYGVAEEFPVIPVTNKPFVAYLIVMDLITF
jgi:hypothetical protein